MQAAPPMSAAGFKPSNATLTVPMWIMVYGWLDNIIVAHAAPLKGSPQNTDIFMGNGAANLGFQGNSVGFAPSVARIGVIPNINPNTVG